MNKELFREDAVKRASSPEQLNQYIKVTNPGVWVSLAAIIILLIGVCVWGVFGRLETTVDAVCVSDGSQAICYMVDSEAIASVEKGQEVKIGEAIYIVDSVSQDAIQVSDSTVLSVSERAKSLCGVSNADWVYEIKLNLSGTKLKAGAYSVKIVTESVSPMSFI